MIIDRPRAPASEIGISASLRIRFVSVIDGIIISLSNPERVGMQVVTERSMWSSKHRESHDLGFGAEPSCPDGRPLTDIDG